MTTFPTYAKILQDGYSEKRESALLRSEFEAGPPRQARIRSKVMKTLHVMIHLGSKSDYASFTTWYSEELNEGANWFNFTDPVNRVQKTGRFVGGGFDATCKGGTDIWTIKMQIEYWG